mmetsp:Transcript_17311/g.36680  ORF Transcript_17311/g.36680 Transcript_17311/m.36680 type:complete len:301 (+) Transcript_17311:1048-1950(+)
MAHGTGMYRRGTAWYACRLRTAAQPAQSRHCLPTRATARAGLLVSGPLTPPFSQMAPSLSPPIRRAMSSGSPMTRRKRLMHRHSRQLRRHNRHPRRFWRQPRRHHLCQRRCHHRQFCRRRLFHHRYHHQRQYHRRDHRHRRHHHRHHHGRLHHRQLHRHRHYLHQPDHQVRCCPRRLHRRLRRPKLLRCRPPQHLVHLPQPHSPRRHHLRYPRRHPQQRRHQRSRLLRPNLICPAVSTALCAAPLVPCCTRPFPAARELESLHRGGISGPPFRTALRLTPALHMVSILRPISQQNSKSRT